MRRPSRGAPWRWRRSGPSPRTSWRPGRSWPGRKTLLIAREAENARDRAAGLAEAQGLEAAAEAERIRLVEGAQAEAEQRRAAIYRDLPPAVLLGLAARELAGKLETIEHVNVTPDLLASRPRRVPQRGPRRSHAAVPPR